MRDYYERLASQYFSNMGMNDMKVSDDGGFALNFPAVPKVNFQWLDNENSLCVYVYLTDEECHFLPDLAIVMAKANYFWLGNAGATVSLCPESGRICIAQKMPIDQLKSAWTMQEKVASFLESCEVWQNLIVEMSEKNKKQAAHIKSF